MRRALLILLASLLALGTFYGCSRAAGRSGDTGLLGGLRSVFRAGPQIPDRASPKNRALAEAAMAQVGKTVTYDPGYSEIEYPGGDVPLFKGVCTDVV
ncbi:MAG: DUF1287 domain-containing protein, partial [Coriobacteriales bacterium]|nr:DUF1287 domain-containing protein [Coriobacteriales bacterium]